MRKITALIFVCALQYSVLQAQHNIFRLDGGISLYNNIEKTTLSSSLSYSRNLYKGIYGNIGFEYKNIDREESKHVFTYDWEAFSGYIGVGYRLPLYKNLYIIPAVDAGVSCMFFDLDYLGISMKKKQQWNPYLKLSAKIEYAFSHFLLYLGCNYSIFYTQNFHTFNTLSNAGYPILTSYVEGFGPFRVFDIRIGVGYSF